MSDAGATDERASWEGCLHAVSLGSPNMGWWLGDIGWPSKAFSFKIRDSAKPEWKNFLVSRAWSRVCECPGRTRPAPWSPPLSNGGATVSWVMNGPVVTEGQQDLRGFTGQQRQHRNHMVREVQTKSCAWARNEVILGNARELERLEVWIWRMCKFS